MGMDLSGKNRSFKINRTSWFFILMLANNYGWQPKGTTVTQVTLGSLGLKDRSEINWDETYFANQWQEVSDDDAAHIANALEKALADIPNQNNKEMQELINNTELSDIDPLQFWSGRRNKGFIKKFIKFCRKGYFLIG